VIKITTSPESWSVDYKGLKAQGKRYRAKGEGLKAKVQDIKDA